MFLTMTIIIVIMSRIQPYKIFYAPLVKDHLEWINLKYHSLIRKIIEEQLPFEPNVETKNRKPLTRPIWSDATWEIRFGHGNCFHVFYKRDTHEHKIHILAVGIKQRNRLFIGGEEAES